MELPTPKRDQWIQHLLMVLAFAIPWAKKAIPALIGVILLLTVIRFIKRKQASIPPQPAAMIALLFIFMLLVLGTTYTEHPEEAWNEIGIKLSFLLFPLLSLITPTLDSSNLSKIRYAFVTGCFLFMAIALCHAVWIVIQHPDWYYFTYDRLSWYIHPTYAATYQALALFILIYEGLKNNWLTGRKWLHLFAVVLLLVFIALLSSKAVYLGILLVAAYCMYIAYQIGFSKGRIVLVAFTAIVLFLSAILVLPTTSNRVKTAVNDIRESDQPVSSNDTSTIAHTSSTSMRFVTWRASWTLISENPFGTGTGDTQPQLNVLYEQQGEHYAAVRKFNAHNQFLQLGAEIGWPAIAALISILYAIWVVGRKDPTAQLFVLLCTLNFLFESFLEVQAGIVFFSFWALVYSRMGK